VTRRCDLSKAEEREDLFKWISEKHKDLNVLLNNAGIQQRISISDNDFYKRAKEELKLILSLRSILSHFLLILNH
jgi:uncharacterized oxidoreductase